MGAGKRDLLIHHDEATGRLVFYATPSAGAAALREKAFDGVAQDVDDLREMTPDAAEQQLGRLVFALIDRGSAHKIGIRDYAAEAALEQDRWVAELEERVAAGDADAHYQLFIQMQLAAVQRHSMALLERADALLAWAVAQGHDGAVAMAENWPLIRAVAERRIARGPAT